MANGSIQDKIARFMNGRNGADELAGTCVWVAVILMVINIFARNPVLTILVLLILAYALFRMTSTNVAARRRESEVFAEKLGPVRPWIRNPRAAWNESRAYKHASCASCGQRVRVPRGKGRLRVTCPKCGEKFEVKS